MYENRCSFVACPSGAGTWMVVCCSGDVNQNPCAILRGITMCTGLTEREARTRATELGVDLDGPPSESSVNFIMDGVREPTCPACGRER